MNKLKLEQKLKMHAFVRKNFKALNRLRKHCNKISKELDRGPEICISAEYKIKVTSLKNEGIDLLTHESSRWLTDIISPRDPLFFIAKDFQNALLSLQYFTLVVESLCAEKADTNSIREHWEEHIKPFRTSLSYLERNLTLLVYELAAFRRY